MTTRRRGSAAETAHREPRYRALLESGRAAWWKSGNFDTWKTLYEGEYARGWYLVDLLRELVPAFVVHEAYVVDVGCGDAGALIAFAQSGARAIGMEFDRGSLERGRVRIGEHQAAVALCGGSAERLPFRESSVDLLILDNVLEHVGSMDAAIAEAHRVLRPGGVLYAVTPKPFALHSLWSDPHYQLAGLVLLPRRAQRWYFERLRGAGAGAYDVAHIPTRRGLAARLARHGFSPIVAPRRLWLRYVRDRLHDPEEFSTGWKRRLGRWIASHPWTIEGALAGWIWDVAMGSNMFLARRRD